MQTPVQAHEPLINSVAPTAPANGAKALRLQFRQAPLDCVLNYLREAAGFVVHVKPDVPRSRMVDLWLDQPLETAEALALVKQALLKTGCALVQKGRLLSVIPSQDLKKTSIPLPAL